jgi:cytidine deaminase
MKEFTLFDHLDDLDTESIYLVHKAREATAHAYAPYSKFFVGSALILEDNTVVTGANQENAAYPLCMCAERVALYVAAAQHPGKKIMKIAVAAHKKNHKELMSATCCGACRQVLSEFELRQKSAIAVVMLGTIGKDDKWIRANSATDLIPFNFVLKS